MITVAILEDDRLVREGMTDMLNDLPDVEVVLAATGLETGRLKAANPHVVLVDSDLQNAHSLHVAKAMKHEMMDSRVIVMDLPAHGDIADFVNAGVAGFVRQDATFDDLVGTIRTVAIPARVPSPRVSGSLFSQIADMAAQRGRAVRTDTTRVTPREREVIALISAGMSNKEIAKQLNIAAETVKTHVRNIMDKLALHTRLQIAAYAHRRGD
jgi:DNA-binding NarL/FixJ family response regulator